MLRAIADTHAVIWYIFDDKRLSDTARFTIEQAAADGDQIDPTAVPELPDRVIAATADLYQVPVISKDHQITASDVAVIW